MVDLKSQRMLASKILKCGRNRVWLDPTKINDISEAITSEDIRRLIKDGVIAKQRKKGQSSYRKKKKREQKKKGKRKGRGSRKGSLGARASRKGKWIKKIRSLRNMLKDLKDKDLLDKRTYRTLYLKTGGGFFRNKKHLQIYLKRNNLLKVGESAKKKERKEDRLQTKA
jgi:large subunit ribosomal protein L19e